VTDLGEAFEPYFSHTAGQQHARQGGSSYPSGNHFFDLGVASELRRMEEAKRQPTNEDDWRRRQAAFAQQKIKSESPKNKKSDYPEQERELTPKEQALRDKEQKEMLIVVGIVSVLCGIRYVCIAYPNESVISFSGLVLAAGVATSDHIRHNKTARVAAPVGTALLTAAAVYAVHNNPLFPESSIPYFIAQHSGSFFDAAVATCAVLYPKTIAQLVRQSGINALLAISAVTMTAGAGYGIYDNAAHRQTNVATSAKNVFGGVWKTSSTPFEWATQDWAAVPKNMVAYGVKAPMIGSVGTLAATGAAVGNGGTSVIRYAYNNVLKPLWNYAASKTTKEGSDKPASQTIDNNSQQVAISSQLPYRNSTALGLWPNIVKLVDKLLPARCLVLKWGF